MDKMLIYSRLGKTYCILKEIIVETKYVPIVLLPKEINIIIMIKRRYHSTNSGEYDLKKPPEN